MTTDIVKQAVIQKLAFGGGAAKAIGGAMMKHPAIAGAGLGGLTGLIAADPGERMRGAILGAGLGAGSFMGGRALAKHFGRKGKSGVAGLMRKYKAGLPSEGRLGYTGEFLKGLSPDQRAMLGSLYGVPMAGLGAAALI